MKRHGQDRCRVCGVATTFEENKPNICGSTNCAAIYALLEDVREMIKHEPIPAVDRDIRIARLVELLNAWDKLRQ